MAHMLNGGNHLKLKAVMKKLALIVLIAAMSLSLVNPTFAGMEKVRCSIPEHVHTENCYRIPGKKIVVCDPQANLHAVSGYDTNGDTICGYFDQIIHSHNMYCYDEDNSLICTLLEVFPHIHSDSCYAEERILACTKDTFETHIHSDECYEVVEKYICGLEGDESHVHTQDCVEIERRLICVTPSETPIHVHDESCYQTKRELICEKPELVPHIHNSNCYQEGKLSCGLLQIIEHQHDNSCVKIEEDTMTSEPQCGLVEHTHSDDCVSYHLDKVSVTVHDVKINDFGEYEDQIEVIWLPYGDKLVENLWRFSCISLSNYKLYCDGGVTSFTDIGEPITENLELWIFNNTTNDDTNKADSISNKIGNLNISLLYGDQKMHPDGVSYYTHDPMSGYIKLEPDNLTENLTDITVTLKIPRKYVEENTVNIPEFRTNSDITEYNIPPVTEDDEYYYAYIDFFIYDRTQLLVLPFTLSFKDDVVPENYELPITATVTCEDSIISASNTNIYKPIYKSWGIDKFVNSNKIEAFKNDGAEVVVTTKDEDGNPYLNDTEYVDFYFRVNGITGANCRLDNYRDATTVILTDTLPSYTDKDGNTKIAKFDPSVNPGWILSEDETAVIKTYTGENSWNVLWQVYSDAPLKLQFPGLKFERDPKDDKNLIAMMTNTVNLEAIPSNEAEGETRPMANDDLRFVITTDPGTDGRFSKTAMKGNIYDTENYKVNPYPWRIRLSNSGVQPLEHIMIQDRKIVDEGTNKVELSGLDENLKFVRLESDLGDSLFTADVHLEDAVEKVVAYYTDGTTQDFPVIVDNSGNFTVEFNKDKVCNGYEIIFKDGFKLLTEEAVSFIAYTVYRNPKQSFVLEDSEKVRFRNSARAINIYNDNAGKPVYIYLTATHSYDMLPITEKLEIKKQTYANSATENNMAGDVYRYWVSLAGFLSEEKEYEKIYIVDLLPNDVDFVKVTHGRELFEGGGLGVFSGVTTGVSSTPRQEENYHNSGRTALIWELPYETLKRHLESQNNNLYYVVFQFSVQIRPDAHPGTITNEIYIVGDNLNEHSGENGSAVDIYDLNNNGRTDDRIAYSQSNAIIIAASSIYAEKFIAPAGSDNWNKQGMSLKAGANFDYLLKVTNELDDDSGLVVYDTLPAIGDKGVLNASTERNSEFRVHLREGISAPTGYTVYYTTSKEVYNGAMADVVNADIWTKSIDEWSAVTAFKLVADEGTELKKSVPFQVRIPACIPAQIPNESMEKLDGKKYQDQASGTMSYLEATNNFGFTTAVATNPKESNSVWVRVPFAGFKIKKINSMNKNGIQGAEFALTKNGNDSFVTQIRTSDDDGFLEFCNLLEGEYTLTETKTPSGYFDRNISLSVIITQDPITLEYQIKFEYLGDMSQIQSDLSDFLTEAGNSSDPVLIENEMSSTRLPFTGSTGIFRNCLIGEFILVVGVVLLFAQKRRWKPTP